MAKTVLKPSAFWQRLDEALGEKWAPLNANSLAVRLEMSQGSTHRWYSGVGLPDIKIALELAKSGGVCVQWLLDGTKPKYPISKDPSIRELFDICEGLDEEGRQFVLKAAKGQSSLDQQHGEQGNARDNRRKHG